MTSFSRVLPLLALAAFVGLAGGWMQEAQKPAESGKYMEPRFPSYLKPPKSVDDVMPWARRLAVNKSARGGLGLGVAQKGETILIVIGATADPMVIEAIQKAMLERGVKVQVQRDYELVGVPRQDVLALRKLRSNVSAQNGYMEAAGWIAQFADPEGAKKWLHGVNPALYDKLYPKEADLPPNLTLVSEKLKGNSVGPAIQAYLKKHPEVKGVYWGKGGGAGLLRDLHPMESKFLGFFTYDNPWEVMSEIPSYPADVWQLSEEQSMEPVAYTDKIQVTDPEGTDVSSAEITEEMSQRWARGVYQRGHLYMFPAMATGRFAFSFVDYPALQKEWIPREPMSMISGVVAGTNGHGGFYPRMAVHFNKNGYISQVDGGGTYGDALRQFLKYPKINDVTFPFHKHVGYWYLYEIAVGTHPKWYRNPSFEALTPERNRSGVIHWGLGLHLWHDPKNPVYSKSWADFVAKYNFPNGHGFHIHSYFPTYRAHLRNADRWVTIIDRGHLTSLDSPEVRALASRYGDPARILAEDWVPETPGINAPGRYEVYGRDPWTYAKAVVDKAVSGSYEHYYPPAKSSSQ